MAFNFINQQPSWVFSLNSIYGVTSSSKPNLFPSTNFFQIRPLRTHTISASSNESSNEEEPATTDPVKLAFARARLYKKSKQLESSPKQEQTQTQNPFPDSGKAGTGNGVSVSENKNDGSKEMPDSIKLSMEKAKDYKKNKGAALGSSNIIGEKEKDSGLEEVNSGNSGYGASEKNISNKDKLSVPSIAFVGLNFSDKKKSRGLPAGLVPLVESYTNEDLPEVEFLIGDASKFGRAKSSKLESNPEEEDLPEVEFLVGDTSKFGRAKSSEPESNPESNPEDEDLPEVEFLVGDASKFGPAKSLEPDSNSEDDSDVYKPKVSTWGVFPRPSNISKAYGGGKTIRAGEVLETEEQKAAKEARTRKLLAAYKSKTGLAVDPKLKAECEKTLKEGDDLMDTGKLKQALPYYEKVMKELPFQTELHGLAALQWSICQDSLTRQGEARVMYEKLQSHPNAQVKKKASQFLFAFQAMEMLKVTSSPPPSSTEGYRTYFEAFVEDKTVAPLKVGTAKGDEEEKEEGTLIQALPYMILLVSPILIVLLIALQKRI